MVTKDLSIKSVVGDGFGEGWPVEWESGSPITQL